MAMAVDVQSDVGFPCWIPLRRRFSPDSPFFASGNIERELLAKQVALDLTEDERNQLHEMVGEVASGIFCPIVGCHARLKSVNDFEDHYTARHAASCSVCQRVYPTSRLLSIHISEAHDSFFQAKVARGYAMYECLVDGCGMKFKSYKSRQRHLVDKHKFPASYDFFKKGRPSKKRRQKLQRKQALHSEQQSSSTMEVEDEAISDLVSAVSKLSTSDNTPSNISFGRRHPRGVTFVPRAVQRERNSKASATPGTKR